MRLWGPEMTEMRKLPAITMGMWMALLGAGGCTHSPTKNSAENGAPSESAIVWLEQGVEAHGMKISLGYRDQKEPADGWLEPAVGITKDGQAVADAMVFCRLVSASGESSLGDEVATVYVPDSGGKSASYVQGKLKLPADNAAVAVRYRIVLPGMNEDWTRDASLPKATTAK